MHRDQLGEFACRYWELKGHKVNQGSYSLRKKSNTNPGNGNFKLPFTNLSLPIGWSSLSQ